MKKILWGCIIANIIYSLSQFTYIVTPAYIIVLLLLIALHSGGNIKLSKILAVLTAIVGAFLSVLGTGNLVIIASGIVIIIGVIYDELLVSNQNKYNSNIGYEDNIKSREKEKLKIVSEYDMDRVRDIFDNFVSEYDKTNYMIEAKYLHTIKVADNAVNIARSIQLDEEGVYLSYLIGILHDIGRFEQVKEYNTLDDSISIDHAECGYNFLKDGLIRQFIQDNKYDEIIFKVVKNHNKTDIDSDFSDDEKLYCSIIRDADKLDIFRRLGEGEYKDDYRVNKDMVMSQNIIEEIGKRHTINVSLVNNLLDQVVLRLAMVYDINYEYTLKTIKQNDYLNRYILLIDTLDFNKIALKKIVNDIYLYIDDRLK